MLVEVNGMIPRADTAEFLPRALTVSPSSLALRYGEKLGLALIWMDQLLADAL